ncbi:MAG: NUDIX hydrolase [Treponema sp.]|jgi:8-oxo-dGTP pyrophosphatase MutT (NUDIX family)|nr:NUDIX hydrolase [Treponema sp.]
MDEKKLIWNEENRKQILDCKVFKVWESYCKSPEAQVNQNKLQTFTVIEAKDWAIVVPVVESAHGKQFVMVWQWRHGARELSLEFPGGVFEQGEDPKEAALRELREETGYVPGKIKKMGEFNPNPAIMSNKVHFFLAQELENCGKQNLDEDEFVEVTLVDAEEVIQNMGKKPYIHALMGTALSLYNQQK